MTLGQRSPPGGPREHMPGGPVVVAHNVIIMNETHSHSDAGANPDTTTADESDHLISGSSRCWSRLPAPLQPDGRREDRLQVEAKHLGG